MQLCWVSTALPIVKHKRVMFLLYPNKRYFYTDGQIFLELNCFTVVFAAINAGLSVSRAGSAAQSKL